MLGLLIPAAIFCIAALLLRFPEVGGIGIQKITLALLALIGLEFLLERLTYLERIPDIERTVASLDARHNCFGTRGTFGSTDDLLRSAQSELFLSGLNLTALTSLIGILEQKARAGVRIRLVAAHPDKRLIDEIALYFGEDGPAFMKRLEANLSVLDSQLQQKYPTRVSIRTTSFRPSFGYAASDPESNSGFIRVEPYTCRSSMVSRPMMQFTKRTRPGEFIVYLDDLRALWDLSIPFPPAGTTSPKTEAH
jgi:hypothetical protein